MHASTKASSPVTLVEDTLGGHRKVEAIEDAKRYAELFLTPAAGLFRRRPCERRFP